MDPHALNAPEFLSWIDCLIKPNGNLDPKSFDYSEMNTLAQHLNTGASWMVTPSKIFFS
jgi:hypothetical protein